MNQQLFSCGILAEFIAIEPALLLEDTFKAYHPFTKMFVVYMDFEIQYAFA